MNFNNYQESLTRKILIYGAPKTGKTDLVGRLAEQYKLWWFDLEDGIKTLVHSPRMKPEWFANIEVFRIPDTQVHPIAARTLLKVVKGLPVEICHAHGAVACPLCKSKNLPSSRIALNEFTNKDILVIDSGSQLATSTMNDIQRDVIAKDKFDEKPEWDAYANQGRYLDRIYSIMQQAPFNCVTVSHEMLVEMEDKKKKLVPIGGTSQFSKTFAKYFDDVCYTEVVNGKHKVGSSTGYSNSIVTGSRSGKVLEKMETPSLLELFK